MARYIPGALWGGTLFPALTCAKNSAQSAGTSQPLLSTGLRSVRLLRGEMARR